MRFHQKLRRVARKNRAVITADPEGLMAALQVTQRLVREAIANEQKLSIIDALTQAIPMSAAKCPARTWWQATSVLLRNTAEGKSSLAILSDAIAAQGKTNIYASKGPQP